MRNNQIIIALISVYAVICMSCSNESKICDVRLNTVSHDQDNSFSKPENTYYKELPDLSPDNRDERMYAWRTADSLKQWSKLKNDVSVSFVNSNTRFSKNLIPEITIQDRYKLKAWKGEKVNTQILLWTNIDIEKLSVEVTNLVSDNGKFIEADNVKPGFVRYVMTTPGYRYREYSSLVADPIDIIDKIPVNRNTVQPIWLSIKVPDNIEAGTYEGTINVIANKKHKLNLLVEVVNHKLPPPEKWEYYLDLWQHPAAIARVHNVSLWSNEHFEVMRPYYTMLANAGQKVITASIVNEPWGHQTYDDFPSLINCIKKSDGSWDYDYGIFDRYIEFVMSCGINKRINCYTLTKFTYFDEKSGENISIGRSSPQYKSLSTEFLNDFTRHLKNKDWFSITAIAMDESPNEIAKEIIAMIKAVDSDWKLALAGNYHPEIEKDLYDYCLYIGQTFPDTVLEERIEQGKPSTFYTCCGPSFPNVFTFSPPAEAVWFGWYAAKTGFSGYLRWAYNSWPSNPLRDSRYPTMAWPGGDTYQIYPGPRSCIRFEKLLEGIQDYEKIRIVRTIVGDEKLKILEEVINSFGYERSMSNINADELVTEAQEILNSL